MAEFLFLVGSGQLSDETIKAADGIAAEHGVTFVGADLPGDGWRYWFAGPNQGAPFDGQLRERVYSALAAADLVASDKPFRLRREISGSDECAECGSRFDPTPRDKRPICPRCK